MPQAAALQPEPRTERYPLDQFLADIAGIAASTEATELRRKSRDFFWYSPVLNELLKDKVGDVVVTPRSEDDVVCVAAACARHRIPLTVRGGATGNYGQCVPLEGGVVLDMTALDAIAWQRGGVVRVASGAKMNDIDAATRAGGFELRMHPSTKRSATIGGFVGGGTGGIGTVTYGGLREPGNILAARIVTLESTPRVLELRGDAAQKVNRAYGTTGIITALEMPLAPVHPWFDVIVAFDDYLDAVRCRPRHRHGGRHRQEARVGGRVAVAGKLQRDSRALPAGAEPVARHGGGGVAGNVPELAAAAWGNADPRGAERHCPAPFRCTSTRGTTPRCRCSRPTAA